MENINVIAIIGKGYTCHINFKEVIYFFHSNNDNTATCKFNTLDNHGSYKSVVYKDIIEINYLGT